MAKHMQVMNPDSLKLPIRQLETVASESVLRQTAVAGARVVRKAVIQRAPIGPKAHKRSGKVYPPGTLRKSVFVVFDEEASLTGVRAEYLVGIGRDAFYWRFLERGSSRQPRKPFFIPGYEGSKSEAASVMTKVLEDKVQKALGKR